MRNQLQDPPCSRRVSTRLAGFTGAHVLHPAKVIAAHKRRTREIGSDLDQRGSVPAADSRRARARMRRRRSTESRTFGTARRDARMHVRLGDTHYGGRDAVSRVQGEGSYIRGAHIEESARLSSAYRSRRRRRRHSARERVAPRFRFASRVATTGPTNGRPDPAGHRDEAGPTRREIPWRACTRQGGPDSTNRREGTASTAREREREGPDGA